MPTAVFTVPELARVGLLEEEAEAIGLDVRYHDTSGWYSNCRIGESTAAAKLHRGCGLSDLPAQHAPRSRAKRLAGRPRLASMPADIDFYFDPVCPFAWMTSKWVRQVQAQREYSVDWRFVSLRLINANVDYDAHFPPEYEAGHTAGLRLLRVAARTRAEHGCEAVARLYAALGARIFDTPPAAGDDTDDDAERRRGTCGFLAPILLDAGLPPGLADALDDDAWDSEIRTETDEALALTGKDVGTPIIHFEPPHGVAFFGPVISRLPDQESAVELWDHVVGLARFGGFAELKRSLREQPQLAAFGVDANTIGVEEDWHGGSRRQKK